MSFKLEPALRRLVCVLVAVLAGNSTPAALRDITQAVVVAPTNLSPVEQRAATMLIEEVEKRSGVRWTRSPTWPAATTPVISLGSRGALGPVGGRLVEELRRTPPPGAEGFQLATGTDSGQPSIIVLGADPRGVLFGVGRLLRELRMTRARVEVSDSLNMVTAPRYALRGHQLGYRPKTHSYDAWDLPVWEQYYRDLIVFGCNAVELIPPRSDDAADSPHFPRPPMDMMVGMSRLADDYGLDVWIWYPAMDPDYSNPSTVEAAMKEWADVFSRLPRIDAVFVPGGDPGHTQPRVLMALLEKQAANLHRHHPRAQMWMSPQGFTGEWFDEFLAILRDQKPAWLNGIVFGPQVRMPLAKLREAIPAQYPIRHYPDITHTRQCQFPVPDWDVAYAITEGRECINPRPEDQAAIFHATQPSTVGFITYSEGCNDDVNKALWSVLGWDPGMNVNDILRDFSRYFIGDGYAESFAKGLAGLEGNWRGSLETNASVKVTFEHFLAMEKAASPRDLRNWRFQQALLRAYSDYYVQQRLVATKQLESSAYKALVDSRTKGPDAAMNQAEGILDAESGQTIAPELHQRILGLGEALFQSISMQLSVEKYKAIAVGRGAMLDSLDFPLGNRAWLKEQFARVRGLKTTTEKLDAIESLVHWEDPGPGGHYDDLGSPGRQPHLVSGRTFAEDPGRMESARVGFEENSSRIEGGVRRVSWMDHAESLYDTPLQLRYTDLDPHATYRLRVVYAGDALRRPIRLVANNGIEIHPPMPKPAPIKPLEFDIPAAATSGGTLTLSWTGEPGIGGNGRGCQVSEVWLIRK